MKRSKLVCLLLVLSLIIIGSDCRKGKSPSNPDRGTPTPLLPGIALLSQRINIGGETIRYLPQGLSPSKGYEIRISAPATIPASIHLWLEPSGRPLQGTIRRRSRKLLNAEKIMFRTGLNEGILYQGKEYPSMDVVFQAQKWALSPDIPNQGSKVLLFDILLEENVLGIPVSALPLVITAVVVVALCVGVLPWWAGAAAPELVRWLMAGAKGRRKGRTKR
ncbi:hypothetical protein Ndes2437A_g04304 [Nannochloris sp. 'desiccata']